MDHGMVGVGVASRRRSGRTLGPGSLSRCVWVVHWCAGQRSEVQVQCRASASALRCTSGSASDGDGAAAAAHTLILRSFLSYPLYSVRCALCSVLFPVCCLLPLRSVSTAMVRLSAPGPGPSLNLSCLSPLCGPLTAPAPVTALSHAPTTASSPHPIPSHPHGHLMYAWPPEPLDLANAGVTRTHALLFPPLAPLRSRTLSRVPGREIVVPGGCCVVGNSGNMWLLLQIGPVPVMMR